ncbi:MAG: 50S ribosomal protein L22 [Candidatus Levybacteria bacterium RIFCSPHIGHO2_01_FULL_36_15]|nr:MAG: 50S ribosomal protein L22 [Candidatus Levybacteria bacterium RIFCSPHIGHO2_01_FULL_36_15]OGH38358.1 MAG: 50S ribosomal protein L22 [Candidatus Levybacteria bacterium RIFCSPLOWO2_01_FULL_36_10]
MEYIAVNKNVKVSPRKVRLVVEGVKKFDINKALAYLTLLHNRSAVPVKKTIESAIANAVNNFKAEKNNLYIKKIEVGEGVKYKRFHFAGRGRTRPYKKRTSNIKITLEERKKENGTKS